MHKLDDLKIWRKAMEIAEKTYLLSAEFPSEEKFGLTSQIRRSTVSVPSNIAEGAGRSTKGEFKNFLSIASGSSYEFINPAHPLSPAQFNFRRKGTTNHFRSDRSAKNELRINKIVRKMSVLNTQF